MRTIILLTMFLFTASVQAFEVPEDAVIKVYDSKGREIGNMSRKEYKVVKIEDHSADTAILVAQHYGYGYEAAVENEKSKVKFSAILMGGVGYNGVEVQGGSGGMYTVSERQTAVGQAILCGSKNRLGLCAGATTNRLYNLGVKVDLN
jgi:hypothetical protein